MVKVALCQICRDYKDISVMKNFEKIEGLYVCNDCEDKHKTQLHFDVNQEFYERNPDLAVLNGGKKAIAVKDDDGIPLTVIVDVEDELDLENEDDLLTGMELTETEIPIKIKLGGKQKKILEALSIHGMLPERELRTVTESNPDNHLFTVLKSLVGKELIEKFARIDKPNDWMLTELGKKYVKQNF